MMKVTMRFIATVVSVCFALTPQLAAGSALSDSLFRTLFDSVYADQRGLDSAHLRLSRPAARSCLEQIEGISPEELGQLDANYQLAFWLNAHHLLVVHALMSHWPTRRVDQLPDGWDTVRYPIGGRLVSIRFIADEIAAKEFRDPRAFFALALPTVDAPTFELLPFAGNILDSQLAAHCRAVVEQAGDQKSIVSRRAGTVHVPSRMLANVRRFAALVPDRLSADPTTPAAVRASLLEFLNYFGSDLLRQQLAARTDWEVVERADRTDIRVARSGGK